MKFVTFILIVAVSWPGAIFAQTQTAAAPVLDAETAPLPVVTEAMALPQTAQAVSLALGAHAAARCSGRHHHRPDRHRDRVWPLDRGRPRLVDHARVAVESGHC